MKPNRMYLVVMRTNLDELPILLTASHQRAFGKARSITEKELDESANVMEVDHAGRITSAVITFLDGVPSRLTLVRDWDDEERTVA